jgi:hypothetical protein
MANSSRRKFFSAAFIVALAGCSSLPGPVEYSDDGLLRVPSSAAAGVYRLEGWPFIQYKEIVLEPLVVTFVRDWEKNHPDVSPKEIKRMRDEAAKTFRESFRKEIIARAKYKFADAPGEKVLLVNPTVVDFDVPAPETDSDMKSYAPGPPKMEIVTELRDSVTGKLVGRVTMFSGHETWGYNQLRPANRITNAHDIGVAFDKYNRLLRETLDVAKVERPRPQKAPPQRGETTE